MIDREQLINETAEVVNRNSMEKAFNDTPDNRRPEKICGTCRYFNPEFPVDGKPAPVCLAIKEMKGGNVIQRPRGTQHYFRCSNGRYENGIGQ